MPKNAHEPPEKALKAGNASASGAAERQAEAAVPKAATGAVVLAALQARPYPEIDLTPPRVLLSNVRDFARSRSHPHPPLRRTMEFHTPYA